MRRLWQIAICISLLWFGTVGLGDFNGEISEVVYATGQVGTSMGTAVDDSTTQPQLIVSASTTALANNEISNKPIVYLTFDDGPSIHTKDVLAILKKAEVKGTFFVLGEHVAKYPDLAKQIIKEGHGIGNHTFNHKYKDLYSSFGEFEKQVIETDKAIYKATGIWTNLVRAPSGTTGNFDQGYFDALNKAGFKIHDWNVDSGDSKRKGVPSDEIIAAVKGSKLRNKVVVLMHDGVGHEESVKALPEIIKYYKNKGYTFAVLTDQVEPIQFQVAKQLKWSRPKVKPDEAAALAMYMKQRGQGAVVVSNQEKRELILHEGDIKLVFTPEEYREQKGVIQVPLRKLTEGLGGQIHWNRQSGAVEAIVGGHTAFWEPPAPVTNTNTQMPSQVMVPLRDTLLQFDIAITRYEITDNYREIWGSMK